MKTEFANVVVLDAATFPPETSIRSFSFPHELVRHERTTASEAASRIEAAHIVITNKVPLGHDALASAKNLRLIAVAATGYNLVDIAACDRLGIGVCNIRNYATNTVPEHTFMLILALRRSLKAYDRSIGQGRWAQSGQFCYFDFPVNDLAGSVLGIIGSGALGGAVAQIGKAFGMRTLLSARKGSDLIGPGYTRFETVIAESDVITLHCPLTDFTRNMIGKREFDAMRPNALLINTARGGLVDELALVEAIEGGKIAGAGFDVTTPEPPANDHPLVRLAGRDNVLLTPHVGWASREAVQTLADQLIDNIEANWAGRAQNLVTSSGGR